MDTLLTIETSWFIALVSASGFLLSRRTLAGGLSGAFLVLLGLGLWYGWRGASYLWALQWAVYGGGILLLWAWLALDPSPTPVRRFHPEGALTALALLAWLLSEGLHLPALLTPLPQAVPDLAEVGFLWTHAWAPLFAWLTIVLTLAWWLILRLWERTGPGKPF